MRILILFAIISISYFSNAQNSSNIILVVNTKAKIVIDTEIIDTCEVDKPIKINLTSGEHYLQAIDILTNEEKSEVLNLESGKQKVIKIEFTRSSLKMLRSVKVANFNFNVPGQLSSSSDEISSVKTFYYAFEEGDRVNFSVLMSNKNGTNKLKIYTYPDHVLKYQNTGFDNLKNASFQVDKRSIYQFEFSTLHTFDRDLKLKIERFPRFNETFDFNTDVKEETTYEVVKIQEPQTVYLNSQTNISSGKTRIVLPINLPANTVKWYYEISVLRNTEDVENVLSKFNLLGDLSQALTGIDASIIPDIDFTKYSSPPGTDYCDVYLLDRNNYENFINGLEFSALTQGTRQNVSSAISEITCCNSGLYHLGLNNDNYIHGVNVIIEMSAIVKKSIMVMVANE